MRQTTVATKPQAAEPENLACPRCESTNTKFCYYNNYNLSQPRYFCKACRRYWTRGGTLRNVPIGGGSRKNTKRPRSSCSSAASLLPPPPAPTTLNTTTSSSTTSRVVINLNANDATSFMSLLTSTAHHDPLPQPVMGLGQSQSMGLGGFGYGFGFGSSMVGELSDGGSGVQVMMDGGDYLAWAPELAISTTGKGGLELLE